MGRGEPGQTRETTLSVKGKGIESASNTIRSSRATNYVAADEKHGTNFQRLRVLVDVADSATPTLNIAAGEGSAKVRIDDVRVVATSKVPTTGILSEDFEDIDQGWVPERATPAVPRTPAPTWASSTRHTRSPAGTPRRPTTSSTASGR